MYKRQAMPCTTILVGKKASYDGSTMIARNDDSGAGHYTSKKFVVIHPEEQARTYKTEISHLTIELPDNPMRYTACLLYTSLQSPRDPAHVFP